MKVFACAFLIGAFVTQGTDLSSLRDAYAAAATEESALRRFRELTGRNTNNVPAVLMAYQGAERMLTARYAVNPINKISAFSKGREMIERALKMPDADLECHFIRYGIQRNLPAILNYRQDLAADSSFISQRLDTLRDRDLRMRITNYLRNNK